MHVHRQTVCKFGAADRTERAKFISDSHTKENFGVHSPGPAHTGSLPASSLGGAPSQPFGTGKRAALHTKVRAHDAHHPGALTRVLLLLCRVTTLRDQAATRSTGGWETTGILGAIHPNSGQRVLTAVALRPAI